MSWSVQAVPLPDGDRPVDLWVNGAGCLVAEPVHGAERLPGRYVAPGLVDAHAHPAVGWEAGAPVALDQAETLKALAGWARSGVCLVRDTGSAGGSVLQLDLLPGMPRLQTAGRFLAPAGQYFPALLPEDAPQQRLTELALGQLARGGRWVKVIADFPSVADGTPSGRPRPTYSGEAIEAMAAAVHAAGGRVAAHVTTDLVSQLVQAGVDSIEHGTAIDESALHLMARTGAAWTPTLCAVLNVPDTASEAARQRVGDYRQRLSRSHYATTGRSGLTVSGSAPRTSAKLDAVTAKSQSDKDVASPLAVIRSARPSRSSRLRPARRSRHQARSRASPSRT